MKITGYKVLIVLGMIILHSLPFICYNYITNKRDRLFTILISSLLNVGVIGITGIYENLFKKIDKQMKKEIKLW